MGFKVYYNRFLDTDLIRDLLYEYLRKHRLSLQKFASFILEIKYSKFYTKLKDIAIWHQRSRDVKKMFHKLKWIINQKPFSAAMKDVECSTYRRRMGSFIHLMESSEYSLESFITNELRISSRKFERLRKNCMEETSLDDESKMSMDKISEFIFKARVKFRTKFAELRRRIKGIT